MLDILYVCCGCLDFFSSTLFCAPSRTCLYFVLLSAIFVLCIYLPCPRAGFLPAFERLLIHLLWVALVWAFICSLVCAPPLCRLSFCVRGLITQLFLILQIICLYAGMFVCRIIRILGYIFISFILSEILAV
jgi:hypothetical protein